MNLGFMADFSESRNQSGFIRVCERVFRRVQRSSAQFVENSDLRLWFTDGFTDSGPSDYLKSFIQTQLRMKARVGIGPFRPRQFPLPTLIFSPAYHVAYEKKYKKKVPAQER